MYLDAFHTRHADNTISVSAEQGSAFAKEIAGDFNPIHDVGSKRFVVPGDLLFALVLNRYGLSKSMAVRFSGMVGPDIPLILPAVDKGVIDIVDAQGKAYLHVEHSNETSHDAALIEDLARSYVAFSGQNFPFIMVPLLEKNQVMFNPRRPLVIYESMAFDLTSLDITSPSLELANTSLSVNGKRGDARFEFTILAGGQRVGTGIKKLIVSGLQPFDSKLMDGVIAEFNQLRANYGL